LICRREGGFAGKVPVLTISKLAFTQFQTASSIFLKKINLCETNIVYTVYMTIQSWISLSLADRRPLYLQIVEQIRRRVAAGDLPPGAELPSIRQLAADLRVSVITTKRAYSELEREGVIVTRQGKGSLVSDRPYLSNALREQELEKFLQQVVSAGKSLGLTAAELQERIAAAFSQEPESDNDQPAQALPPNLN
jgi:GntR family transcriptional regulator